MDNSLFHVIRLPAHRPLPAITRPSKRCLEFIHRTNLSFLVSQRLTDAYQLCCAVPAFRRCALGPINVAFVPSLVSATIRRRKAGAVDCGWPVLQQEVIVSAINRILGMIEQTSGTIGEATWEQCTLLLG
uniref:Uncharacterized protein n=1 Tax=Mesocestoides corti TaxID=53468 RepID=A0A5K3G0T1_MESCO